MPLHGTETVMRGWFALGLVIGITGCGSSEQAASHTPVAATQVVAAPTAKPTAVRPTTGSYTDSQTGVTATIVQAAADTRGSQYLKPKAGSFWEELQIRVHNGSASPQEYNGLDFKVLDAKGQEYGPTVYLDNKVGLNSGKIPPGQSRLGWIGFEVPKMASTITVTWGDSFKLDPPAELVRYTVR